MLGLYSSGQTKGLVVDSGEGGTHVVPVYEGYISKDCVQRNDFCGEKLTKTLLELFKKKGFDFSSKFQMNVIKDVKEKHCYLSRNYAKEV